MSRRVELAGRDLRPLQREMLEDNQVVLALRYRAEMLMMADGKFHSAADVTNALLDAMEKREVAWAPPCWRTSQPKPYSSGTSQHLSALRYSHELLESGDDVHKNGSTHLFRLKREARKHLSWWREENEQLLKLLTLCECGQEKTGAAISFGRACDDCQAVKAADALPQPAADFEYIAARYERDSGCPVIFGVTLDLERVIRVATLRGVVEHELDEDMTWHDAVDKWLGG